MELRGSGTQGIEAFRFIRFSNGEVMAEIERHGSKKQHLTLLPSQVVLYSGLSDEESPEVGGKNPFMFMDLAFTYPFQALQLAHPEGPSSVTSNEVSKEIVLERKHAATITTRRLSGEQISFRLALKGDVNKELDGVWDGRLQEPLPGDLPIANWRHRGTGAFNTLRDARSSTK